METYGVDNCPQVGKNGDKKRCGGGSLYLVCQGLRLETHRYHEINYIGVEAFPSTSARKTQAIRGFTISMPKLPFCSMIQKTGLDIE